MYFLHSKLDSFYFLSFSKFHQIKERYTFNQLLTKPIVIILTNTFYQIRDPLLGRKHTKRLLPLRFHSRLNSVRSNSNRARLSRNSYVPKESRCTKFTLVRVICPSKDSAVRVSRQQFIIFINSPLFFQEIVLRIQIKVFKSI